MNTKNLKSSKGCWYSDGLHFKCQRCGKCCRGEPGYIWVSKGEIKKIANYLGISLDAFGRKYLKKVNGRYSLVEFTNGDCMMYDNGCKIYPVRPCQCATFPFWQKNLRTPADWKKVIQICPGVSDGPLYTQKEIQNIVEIQQRYDSQE